MKKHDAWGNLFLRVLLGIIFAATGTGKLFMGNMPVEPIGGILSSLGLNAISAAGFGLFLGILELMIGLMLILGLFTKIVGWVASITLLCFILGVGVMLGDGLFGQMMMFKDLGLLGGTLALAFQGSKGMSLDEVLWKK